MKISYNFKKKNFLGGGGGGGGVLNMWVKNCYCRIPDLTTPYVRPNFETKKGMWWCEGFWRYACFKDMPFFFRVVSTVQ